MSKKLITRLMITALLGTAGYLGYTYLQSENNNSLVEIDKNPQQTPSPVDNDTDMDLNTPTPSEPTVKTTTTETMDAPQEIVPSEPVLDEEEPDLSSDEEVAMVQESHEPIIPKAVQPAIQEQPKPQKPLSKQEKLDKFARNMEDLHNQAADEWAKMSAEERQEAEQQVAIFQQNFQQEIERLSKLSPEEVEMEKQMAMAKLQQENPEAYQAVKSMEEAFMEVASAE